MSSFARTPILIASFHTVVAVGRWKHDSRPSCFISPTTHYLVVVASEVDPRTIQVWFSGFRIGTRVHNSPFPSNSILLVSSFLFDAVSNSMLLQSPLVNEEGYMNLLPSMLVSGFVLSLLYFPPVFVTEIPAIKDIGNKLAKLIICVSRVSFGWKKFTRDGKKFVFGINL